MISKPIYIEVDDYLYERITSVQYDNGTRFLDIHLLSNGQAIDLTGTRVIISGEKPDGEEIFNSTTMKDALGGNVIVELTEQMNAVPGDVKCQLEIYGEAGQLLTTKTFNIEVTKRAGSKTVASSSEFNALKKALEEVQDIDNRFAQTNAQLSVFESRIEEVATDGIDTESANAIVKEVIDKAVADGIPNESLTFNKVDYSLDEDVYDVDLWEIGTLYNGTGGEGSSNTRIRSNFIKCFKGSNIVCETPDMFIVLYDINKKYINIQTSFSTDHIISDVECWYIRIVLRKSDNTEIISDEIPSLIDKVKLFNTAIVLNKAVSNDSYKANVKWMPGGINGGDGSDTISDTTVRTDVLQSVEGQEVYLKNKSDVVIFVQFFDKNKQHIGFSPSYGSFSSIVVEHPYFRVSSRFNDSRTLTPDLIEKINEDVFISSTFIDGNNIQNGTIKAEKIGDKQIEKKHLATDVLKNDVLKGKTVLNLGDSIADARNSPDIIGYRDLLELKDGMIVTSYAKGGATIMCNQENNICSQVDKAILELTDAPDFILFDGYTNDVGSGSDSDLGDLIWSYDGVLNKNQFCGAFEYVCRTLKSSFPDSIIIYIRPHNMASRSINRQREWGEKALEVCEKYSIPVVDIFKNGNLNTQFSQYVGVYTDTGQGEIDRTHPNSLGYEKFYYPPLVTLMRSLVE